jgi:hypothetical protein
MKGGKSQLSPPPKKSSELPSQDITEGPTVPPPPQRKSPPHSLPLAPPKSRQASRVLPPNKQKKGGAGPKKIGDEAEEIMSELLSIERNIGKGRQTVSGSGKGGMRIPELKFKGKKGSLFTRGSIVEIKASVKGASLSARSRQQIRDFVAFARKVRERAAKGQIKDPELKQRLLNAYVEVYSDLPAPKKGEFAQLIEEGLIKWRPLADARW